MLALSVVPLLVVVLFVAGCTSSRLHKQDFEGRSIAATAAFPPKPTIHDQYLVLLGRRRPGSRASGRGVRIDPDGSQVLIVDYGLGRKSRRSSQ